MFTASEQQVLLSTTLCTNKKGDSTRDDIEKAGEDYFCSFKMDWCDAFKKLLEKGDLIESNGRLSVRIGLSIDEIAKRKPRYKYWYNDWYRLAEKSEKHSELCAHAYGIDLCQTGMMTKRQIDYLSTLIKSSSKGLDAGCGVGKITEYIWSITNATILGVDTIYSGIRLAKQRTAISEGLEFKLSDIRPFIATGDDKYDFIMSLDTLYFLGDGLGSFVIDCVDNLSAKGKLFIFYSAWDGKDNDITFDGNNLGKFLTGKGIDFHYVDYSDDDYDHWEKKKDFLERNKASFVSEGFKILHERRYAETVFFKRLISEKKVKRYLYTVHK